MWKVSPIRHTFYGRNQTSASMEYINRRVDDKTRKLFRVRCAYEKRLDLYGFLEKS